MALHDGLTGLATRLLLQDRWMSPWKAPGGIKPGWRF